MPANGLSRAGLSCTSSPICDASALALCVCGCTAFGNQATALLVLPSQSSKLIRGLESHLKDREKLLVKADKRYQELTR